MRCPNCGQENRPGARFCSQCRAILKGAVGPALAPGQTMNNGQYRVIRQLGRGGMGAIYLAANTQAFDRPCVIKEMLAYYEAGQEQDALQRFEREAKTLASLKHPGIPDMYGYFSEGGHNYIVMEYIEGENLAKRLSSEDEQGNIIPGKPLSVEDTLRYGIEICRVLEYLSNLTPEPFVHNDIKPANIIIDKNSGQAVLVDFGTAKARYTLDSGGKVGLKKSDVYGTVGYAPPEQYQGRSEPRSDVYALAATMYHLLTDDDPRAHPFKFPRMAEALAELRLVLEKALTTDVNQRLTAIEFRRQLEAVRASRAGTVQPISFPQGDIATTVTGVLDLSLKHWDYARRILYDGSLAAWLRNSLYNPIAADQAQEAVKKHPEEPDAGLDTFLRGLNPRLPKPQLRAIESELDFGDLEPGESKELPLAIVNTSPAGAHGEIESSAPWLRPASRYFGLPPQDRKNLLIRVANTGGLTPDQRYSDTVTLRPADGSPLRVNARMRVIPPTPTQRLKTTALAQPKAQVAQPRPQRQPIPWATLFALVIIALLAVGAYFVLRRGPVVPGDYRAGLQALQQNDWEKAQRILKNVDPKSAEAVAEVGRALDQQWVEVPAGTLQMGREDGSVDERPLHPVKLNAYALQRFEVTNVQYQRFVNARNHPAPSHWKDGYFPKGQALLPVVNVTWQDAIAYGEWLSQDTGQKIRLPSEAEWEWAARGEAGRLYPWGNTDEKKCRNAADQEKGGAVAVGSYPCGATPSGIMDLAGNVREWTLDTYGPYRDPHSPPPEGRNKVVRGGSWSRYSVASTVREHVDAAVRSGDVGFRCLRAKA